MKVDERQDPPEYNTGERASDVKVETESNNMQRNASVIDRDEPKIEIVEQHTIQKNGLIQDGIESERGIINGAESNQADAQKDDENLSKLDVQSKAAALEVEEKKEARPVAQSESEKPGIGCCKYWVLSILFAAFVMGIALYIYATNLSQYGAMATAYIGPIPLVGTFFFKFLVACRDKYYNGKYWDKSKSNLINEDNTLKKINFVPLLTSVYANCAHYVFFSMAFKYAKLAGINQGVVTVMVVMATIFNSITFYFFFGEKPSCNKIIGMLFCICATVMLCVNGVLQEEDNTIEHKEGETSRVAYAIYSLSFAILVPVGFSLKHFMIRNFKAGYRPLDLVMDSSLLENFVFSIVSIYRLNNGGIETKDFLIGGLTGVLRNLGNQFMGVGIAYGQGGPGQSLMSTNSIWLTFYTVIFDGQSLQTLEVLALSSGIFGAFVIAMGDQIIDKFKSSFAKDNEK